MENGDLSNEVAPRLLFVFEGTIGRLKDGPYEIKERTMLRLHRWAKAVDCWEIPEIARTILWDAAWRWSYRFDIVTHRPKGFADALPPLLDESDIPYTKVWSTSPAALAKKLSRMPDVAAVYFTDPAQRFAYGQRGVLLEEGLVRRIC